MSASPHDRRYDRVIGAFAHVDYSLCMMFGDAPATLAPQRLWGHPALCAALEDELRRDGYPAFAHDPRD